MAAFIAVDHLLLAEDSVTEEGVGGGGHWALFRELGSSAI
jgi:hypothetical protein